MKRCDHKFTALHIYPFVLFSSLQGIPGVPKLQENSNPATWMLEITSASTEVQLGLDFGHIYKRSHLYG